MKQTIKKSIALVLTLVMVLSVFAISVNATENNFVAPENANNGDLLLTVDFSDKTGFNYTVDTTANAGEVVANKNKISATSAHKTNSIRIEGNFDGITMGAGSIYTIDFALGGKYQVGYADYVNFKMSDGSMRGFAYLTATKAASNFIKETAEEKTVAANTFLYYNGSEAVFTPKVVVEDEVSYTFYRIVVDYDKKTITPYVLSDMSEYVCATQATVKDCDFATGNLDIKFSFKHKVGGVTILSDVKVYKGNLQKGTTGEVNSDGKTETKTIDGYTYTLPTQKKAGYMFAGWKVNDAEAPTPAGTVVPTKGLTKLTAVFEKVMSDTYLQFGNSNATAKTTDVRIVSLIDTLNYKSVGYKVSIKKAGSEIYHNDAYELKYIYTALSEKYGGAEITLSSLGYGTSEGYFTALTLKNVSTDNADITVELTPYQIDTEGNKTEGQTIVIDLDAKWAEHSAAQ